MLPRQRHGAAEAQVVVQRGVLLRSNAKGGLYRPLKQQITLRIDADILAWFSANAGGWGYQRYETEINRMLREHTASLEP